MCTIILKDILKFRVIIESAILFFADEVHSFVTMGIIPREIHIAPHVSAVLITIIIIRKVPRPVREGKFSL